MSVFLLVLKIIGLTLAGIAGLIIALLLTVLLVPVRYKVSEQCYDKTDAAAKVSWLMHILTLSCTYNEDFDYSLKLFGFITLYPVREKARKAKPEDSYGESFQMPEDARTKDDAKTKAGTSYEKNFSAEPSDTKEPSENKAKQKATKIKRSKKKKGPSKLEQFKKKFSELKAKIDDPKNKKAVGRLKTELVRLLKAIWPKSCKGFLQYCLKDPARTGQLTGLISMLPIAYQKRVNIRPDFTSDEMYFEGDILLKGYIQIVTLVVIALRLYTDKNVRYLFKQISD